MALAVVQDEAAHPTDVGFLGADRVVIGADRITNHVEQLLLSRFGRGCTGRIDRKSPLDIYGERAYNIVTAKQDCNAQLSPPLAH